MEYSNEGLTVWFDTSDAPLAAGALTVGVRPAHAANAVTVRCRLNGRPSPALRARGVGSPRPGQPQYFRADLPACAEGVVMELLPILTCAGRQAPRTGGDEAPSPVWLRHVCKTPAPAKPGTDQRPLSEGGTPRFAAALEFLGQVTVHLAEPVEEIGVVPAGLRRNFYIGSGRCRGPRLNAEILPEGADWMVIQRDGVAVPNVRTTWKTPEGALLFGEYSGVFDLGGAGFENALRGVYPALPVVQLAPRFVTSDGRYAWLNRAQCIGVGNVDMDRLLVEYDLYAVTGGRPAVRAGRTERA